MLLPCTCSLRDSLWRNRNPLVLYTLNCACFTQRPTSVHRCYCSTSGFPCVGVRLIYWSLRCKASFVICFHWSLLLAFSVHFSSSSAFLRLLPVSWYCDNLSDQKCEQPCLVLVDSEQFSKKTTIGTSLLGSTRVWIHIHLVSGVCTFKESGL